MFGLGEQVVEAVAHVDGRGLSTFRALITRPGLLTDAYVSGRRKPYLVPLQVFLIANLVFFGFQSLFRANVFSTPLQSQVSGQFYKAFAQRRVDARLAALKTTEKAYAPAYDRAALLNAKSLIILMTPPMALLAGVLFFTRRKPFVTHIVFALHFYAFWLLAFCLLTPITAIAITVFMKVSGTTLAPSTMDLLAAWVWLAAGVVYLGVAVATVYGERGLSRVLKVVLLALEAGVTVFGYRFWCFSSRSTRPACTEGPFVRCICLDTYMRVRVIKGVDNAFDIIVEPNRRAILGLLVSSEQSVGEIERHLRMPQPTVSKHLRVLRDAGFVEPRWTRSAGSTG